MLALVVIIVACLFFLGLGLLISTNVLVVLIFALIGLLLGGLAGVFLIRGPAAQENWAILAGPPLSSLFFVMICGALNLVARDNLGVQIGGLRMYSVAFLLGSGPGLLVGWVLGQNVGGRQLSKRRPLETAGRSRSAETTMPGRSPVAKLLPPLPAPLPTTGQPQASMPDTAPLLRRVISEQSSLSHYGQVQILDPHDGTVCVIVTQPHRHIAIYLVCGPTYPQQPPALSIERADQPINVGPGVLFEWNGAHHRLSHVVEDWINRL